MNKSISWFFPLTDCHEGIPFGNADIGALVWGEGRTLRVTISRADLWDHQGGLEFGGFTFRQIRAALEANDEPGLRALFPKSGTILMPTALPLGRFEFVLPAGAALKEGRLALAKGVAEIDVVKNRLVHTVRVCMDPESGLVFLRWPAGLRPEDVAAVPAWDNTEIRPEFSGPRGYLPPERFDEESLVGWEQTLRLPDDPPVAAFCATRGAESVIATARGTKKRSAATSARALLPASAGFWTAAEKASSAWWRAFWKDAPDIDTPNRDLDELFTLGLYKFGSAMRDGKFPCGLQGPWIEDYRLPPWSADFHFNINVQMCYWPAFLTGRADVLRPLFDMMLSWTPKLRKNAEHFLGIKDGVMLPHAVDDRGTCMGNFWTGVIDHGCTMWMADFLWRYYRLTGDRKFLREKAFPFMSGAINTFYAMLEKTEGGALSLPVGVSPEYGGSGMRAWGRDPSFQLAAAHRLVDDLLDAAKTLRVAPDARWTAVHERLPRYTTASVPIEFSQKGAEVIALWKGKTLSESHRHHSHMGAIAPFDVIDCDDPSLRKLIDNTYRNWMEKGYSGWSGWCLTWASMLHARVGNGEMAELMLDFLVRLYTNKGHATRHDVAAAGFSWMGGDGIKACFKDQRHIMQLDAAMGAVVAVGEMFVHEKRGELQFFKGVPARWRDCSFKNFTTPDGKRVSGYIKDGKRHVTVKEKGGKV